MIKKCPVLNKFLDILKVPKVTNRLQTQKEEEGLAVIEEKRIVRCTPFLKNVNIPPSNEDKITIYKIIKNLANFILVTDIRSFRGLECGNVVVLTDGSEHHGRMFIAECLSRCTSNQLYFVSMRSERKRKSKSSSKYQTLNVVFDELRYRKDIIEFKTIDITEHRLLQWRHLTEHLQEETGDKKVDFSHRIDWNNVLGQR